VITFSVVIPVRNGEPFLASLFMGLERQTLPADEFEVILVDDASSDRTRELAIAWAGAASERRRLLDGRGLGPAHARNTGLRQARAEWVVSTDCDVIPEPGWLAACARAIRESGAAAIEGAIDAWPPEATGGFNIDWSNGTGGRFMTANMAYHRATLESLGGFDEAFPEFLEDSDVAFRLLDAGHEIAFCPHMRVAHLARPRTVGETIASARRMRWLALFESRHPTRYRDTLRSQLRPLTHVELDVLVALAALATAPRARGLPRAVLLGVAANGLRRGLGAGEVRAAPWAERPARSMLSVVLPVAKAFWWLEGCVRFRNSVW
jgi:GT2 family glycosyltransferase